MTEQERCPAVRSQQGWGLGGRVWGLRQPSEEESHIKSSFKSSSTNRPREKTLSSHTPTGVTPDKLRPPAVHAHRFRPGFAKVLDVSFSSLQAAPLPQAAILHTCTKHGLSFRHKRTFSLAERVGPGTRTKLSHGATGRLTASRSPAAFAAQRLPVEPGRTLTWSARHVSHSTCLLQPSRRWSLEPEPLGPAPTTRQTQSIGHPAENPVIDDDAVALGVGI